MPPQIDLKLGFTCFFKHETPPRTVLNRKLVKITGNRRRMARENSRETGQDRPISANCKKGGSH
jgi:hypothetical protein